MQIKIYVFSYNNYNVIPTFEPYIIYIASIACKLRLIIYNYVYQVLCMHTVKTMLATHLRPESTVCHSRGSPATGCGSEIEVYPMVHSISIHQVHRHIHEERM